MKRRYDGKAIAAVVAPHPPCGGQTSHGPKPDRGVKEQAEQKRLARLARNVKQRERQRGQ